MGCGWLLRRIIRLALLTAISTSVVVALVRGWGQVGEFLNGAWPPWVSNVANVVQLGGAIALLALWLTNATRARSIDPGRGAAARLLGLLALLLPARDRERFVGEVLGNMAELRWRQRVEELLSVAAAVLGLAVIVRWAWRRRV